MTHHLQRAPRPPATRSPRPHRSARAASARLSVVGACATAAVTSTMIGPSA